ncbi:MAG: Rieske (2Fe-2S) protein, partial [Hyphomicrobiales bacterium]
MKRQTVCKLSDLEVGKLHSAKLGRSEIVLSLLPSGAVSAFSGKCPHQGAELKFGCVADFVEGDQLNKVCSNHTGEILRCPWHGFEYSMITGEATVQSLDGKAPAGPLRLRMYNVEID